MAVRNRLSFTDSKKKDKGKLTDVPGETETIRKRDRER